MHACGGFGRVWLSAAPRTAARHTPLSMGFSRQEHWSGLPGPPPGDLSETRMEPMSPESLALSREFFTTSATWEALLNGEHIERNPSKSVNAREITISKNHVRME